MRFNRKLGRQDSGIFPGTNELLVDQLQLQCQPVIFNTFFNYNYVTLSRGTCAKNVRVLVPDGSIHVFKSDWAQPLHKMRVSVLQFYAALREKHL